MRRKPSATLVLSKSPKCIHNAIVARCTLTISFITLRLFKRRRRRLRLSYVIMLKRFTIFWALSKLGLFNPRYPFRPICPHFCKPSVSYTLQEFPYTRRFRPFRLCSHILVLWPTCKISGTAGRSTCSKTTGSWCNGSSCRFHAWIWTALQNGI